MQFLKSFAGRRMIIRILGTFLVYRYRYHRLLLCTIVLVTLFLCTSTLCHWHVQLRSCERPRRGVC